MPAWWCEWQSRQVQMECAPFSGASREEAFECKVMRRDHLRCACSIKGAPSGSAPRGVASCGCNVRLDLDAPRCKSSLASLYSHHPSTKKKAARAESSSLRFISRACALLIHGSNKVKTKQKVKHQSHLSKSLRLFNPRCHRST